MEGILKKKLLLLLKIGILISIVFFVLGIFRINFSFNSDYFDGDMYSDILYSKYAYQYHDVFPDCWVFGNQVYVFATPVISSFFYGFTDNPYVTMGIASSIMALGVILSFLWMIKSVFKNIWLRLTTLFIFLALTLLVGNPILDVNGWQLLFTMCSYYACYAIVAFLGFGIYINIKSYWENKKVICIIILIIECILSFFTGMNSIRQTVIMSIPLLGVEFLFILIRVIKKQKAFNLRTGVACLISVSNALGVVTIKLLNVPMNTIYGQLKLNSFKDIFGRVDTEIYKIITLFGDNIPKIICILIGALILGFSAFVLIKTRTEEKIILFLLLLSSIGIVYLISVFISLETRNIYYFILFPFTSILAVCSFELFNQSIFKYFSIIVIAILILTSSMVFLQSVPMKRPSNYVNNEYQQISDYLIKNNITTVYCPFTFGGKISLDSGLKIQNGFWFNEDVLKKVDYICNPEIFNTSCENCAFVFTDENMKNTALLIADSKKIKMHLLYYSAKKNFWIYSASQNWFFTETCG